MIRTLFLLASCAIFLFPALLLAAEEGEAFFEQHIRPVLVNQCIECHGTKKQESGLRLDARSMLLKGGDSGAAVVVGKPAESLLMEAIRREGLEMPPSKSLEDHEIAAFEKWIKMGAPWPNSETPPQPALGDQVAINAAASDHWAFEKLQTPAVPSLKNDWGQSPIDAFVWKRLTEAKLQPSPPADRGTLIRRAYYDLIGLPPTYEEVQAFEQDPSPQAFENVVDRLLNSKHFGERWGRYWLDLARYADTQEWQAQTDVRYPFAYTYRDWVIHALNRDLPYDEFIKLQIAADFYTTEPNDPNLAAMGFLTVGRRFRNNPIEQTNDRIDAISRGLMGLTVACARCHDHKYDPVPTADYYSLFGVLNSSEMPEDLPIIRGGQQSPELVADYKKQRAAKVKDLKDYIENLRQEAHQDLRKRLPLYFAGYYEMGIAQTKDIRGVIQKLKVKETAMTPLANNLDQLQRGRGQINDPIWGPWVQLLKVPNANFEKQSQQILAQLAEQSQKYNARVVTVLSEKPLQNKKQLTEIYAKFFEGVLTEWRQTKQETPDATNLNDPAAEQLRAELFNNEGVFAFTPDAVERASRLLGTGRRALGDLNKAINEVDATHPSAPPRAMVMVDKETLYDPFVMLRGEPRRRGDSVPRRFLSIVAGEKAPEFTKGSGRRELAEAIADPQNPLTSRVLINRVWMKLLGQGFVSTPGDFGLRSEPPSHPELMDYLAVTFVEDGWSLKKLIRRVMLSSTYQQQSENREDAAQLDPENRLLWRANRKRLDFEAMRDSILAASGKIDLTVGGQSVKLSEEPFTTRRTLYGYIDRVDTDPIFKIFDAASPDVSTPQRNQTTVPQQALFAMNHPFVVQQSKALAARANTGEPNASERVANLYRLLFGRNVTEPERRLALGFLQTTPPPASPTAPVWSYGYGPFDPQSTEGPRFTPLTHWTGQQYQYGAELPDRVFGHIRLNAGGGVPGRRIEESVIRRWTSPIDGVVSITGTLKHIRPNGNGVRGRIIAADGKVLGEWDVARSESETNVAKLQVKRGDTIDFAVENKGNSNSYTFFWAPEIQAIGESSADLTWDAQRDFEAPPPAPMNAWEQLAQALMLSNEFLFVD